MSEDHGKQFRDEAMQSLQSGQFDKALELINQAIELNDRDSEAHVLKGITLSQLNRPDEATQAFREAISCGPSNAKAYFNLAVHQYTLGQKVEAESMAREAVRLDPSHAGARDLVGRIQRELSPELITPTGKVPANPGNPADPLSGGTAPPSAGPGQGAPPAGAPGPQGGQPNQGPQQNYYRPPYEERSGYNNSNIHSIAFIGNMGKGWDTFGYIVSALNILIFVVTILMILPMLQEAFKNPEAFRNQNAMMMSGAGPAVQVMEILGYLIRLISLVWMILDLSDRRGNWLWLIPFILCCCCGLPGMIMPFYIWKGRS